MKPNSSLYILLLLGALSAFGPFVTDFYLPALPALSGSFQTSASMVQLTLTVSMVGLAVGQLFIGPLSDRYGRKQPLVVSLVLFLLSTAGCLAAGTIGAFLLFRFLQGMAGAGGVVLSKSIAMDLYEGRRLAQFFSLLSSVQGIAPICAPVLGGMLLAVTDWRGIFWTLIVVGIVLLIGACRFQESLLVAQNDILSTFKSYKTVIKQAVFLRYVGVQALAMGVMFVYISASPFLFQEHYGLSPMAYSVCFGINALAIMAGSLLIVHYRSTEQALRAGVSGFFLMALIVAAVLVLNLPVVYVEVALFCLLFCLGLILPASTALALEPVRAFSGNASAVLGFMSFFVGGVCSPLAGLGNMQLSTALLIMLCAGCTLGLTYMKKQTL